MSDREQNEPASARADPAGHANRLTRADAESKIADAIYKNAGSVMPIESASLAKIAMESLLGGFASVVISSEYPDNSGDTVERMT